MIGSTLIQELPGHDYQGKRCQIKCNCGEVYTAYKRNVKRSKVVCCPNCRFKLKQLEMSKARLNKVKWVEPIDRLCKSCGETKLYKLFPPKRHTCSECSNIGRLAYYDNSFKYKEN